MKNKIEDLRNHLFATLEALRDEENPMDLDRAGKIAEVAKVVVDTAKAEVEFLKATGSTLGSGFIPQPEIASIPSRPQLVSGVTPRRKCESCTGTTTADPCEHCGTAWRRSA